jgi:predicted nucleic acid-binding protein
MTEYLFDSTVLIDYLRGQAGVQKYIQILLDQPRTVTYSAMTEAELWTGVRHRQDEQRHRDALSRMKRLGVTSRIARIAGRFYGRHKAQGLSLPDAIIAATALVHRKTLLTRNTKHFELLRDELSFEFYSL